MKYMSIESHEPMPDRIRVSPAWESDKRKPMEYVPERTCKFEVETDALGFPKNHVCTNCKEPTTGYGHIDWSYCPNCGAKVVEE